jgi:hypothetical protein
LDAEGALELGESGVVGMGRVGAPGASEDAADDPAGARDESVEGGVVGVDEQFGEPAMVAAEGEPVSVKEYNAGDIVRMCECGGCGDAGAERVADEYRTQDVQALFEAFEELKPAGHRVRAAALAVTEGRQIERVDAVSGAREERADPVPDPRRLGGAAEQHDWRATAVPGAVGEEGPVNTNKRPGVERARWPRTAARRKVERERRQGDGCKQHEHRQR